MLRLVLQGGAPPAALRAVCRGEDGGHEAGATTASPSDQDAALDASLWAALPVGARAAWTGGRAPRLTSADSLDVAYVSLEGPRAALDAAADSGGAAGAGGEGAVGARPAPTSVGGAAFFDPTAAPATPVLAVRCEREIWGD